MPNAFSTLTSASHAPFRSTIPRPKPAPIPCWQQKANRQERADRQAQIDAEISSSSTTSRRPQTNSRKEAINPYNAWKHKKALENQEKGIAQRADKLHEEHFAEYQQLTEEQKQEMCDSFSKEREQNMVLRRDTPRGRIQDFSNTVRNLKMIMNGACQRVGADGFFCLFRNNSDFFINPEWHFSRKELEDYMPLLPSLDVIQQKADAMKGDIRALVKKSLVEVSGIADAEMAYSWYEEDNPSHFSTSLPNLRTLLDALKTEEKKWDADVAAGLITAKSRSERKDKGVPRKRTTPASKRKRVRKEKENEAPARKKTSAPAKTHAKKSTATVGSGVRDDETTRKAARRLRSHARSRATIEDSDGESAEPSVAAS
ncbi:hypothetical protein B0H14DRAFT_3475466 [Mycena olivaceomarginata]|nr:hypothetical protein B0H14DRAFT_3475466 [Mycena olivaceomarginata]